MSTHNTTSILSALGIKYGTTSTATVGLVNVHVMI